MQALTLSGAPVLTSKLQEQDSLASSENQTFQAVEMTPFPTEGPPHECRRTDAVLRRHRERMDSG